jgi:hypothetical protein
MRDERLEQDEVERVRRVRAEIHARFRTLDAYLAYLRRKERRRRLCASPSRRRPVRLVCPAGFLEE